MRKSEVVLSVALLVSIAMSGWLWSELRAERALNTELATSIDELKVVAQPTPVSPPVEQVAAPVQATAAATSAATTVAAAPASPQQVTGTAEDWDSYRRRMMADPRYREAQREQSRITLAPRHANLIRLLGLTPEQADAVIDLQIEREWQRQELMTNVANEDERQQRKQRDEAQEAEHQAKLGKLMSGEQHARLEHYMETRQTRMQVDTFRTQLSGADGLRDDQIEPLIEALHVERAKMRDQLAQYRDTLNWDGQATDTWRSYEQRQAELMKTMHADMHAAASAILSNSQLQQLDSALQRELQRHEAQRRMNQIQSKLDRANPAPSPN